MSQTLLVSALSVRTQLIHGISNSTAKGQLSREFTEKETEQRRKWSRKETEQGDQLSQCAWV